MIRAGIAVTLTIALAACATTPRAANSRHGAPLPSTAPRGAPALRDPHEVMIDGALSMLGQPYRFGGAAPGGFDCSGLVEYAANGAGIRLPRTAQEQLRWGEPVARDALQAGDLIFMHLTHKELHVAIALDNQRFIHAPATGGRVRIDTLAAPPYASGFMSARRVIPAQ